jgi:type II secretory pathway component GspD/PulD (secretin)
MFSSKPSIIAFLGAALILNGSLSAQDASVMRLNSPQFEAEASKLRGLPTRPYEFSKAVLGDVIRFLATDAGISFFSLPEGSPEADRLITFSLKASPFQALETLTKANGLSLILDGGIWYVRPADDTELIGRPYEIKHNAMERVTKSNGASGGGATGAGGGDGGAGAATGGGQGGGQGAANGGVDLQGANETFTMQRSELINDIRSILDLAAETSTGSENVSVSPVALSSAGDSQNSVLKSRLPLDPFGNIRKPKIIWKSDSNTLYVVATRLQHMWVEGYLAAADKPQPLIGIEVKFFETSRDPSSEFGIDWSGTLGSGGTFREVNSVTTDPTTGAITATTNNVPNREGGYRADLANLLSPGNLADAAATFMPPAQAVLSAQDLNLKLRAMLRDDKTTTTSYPRMVTTNNREVVIRSVVNQPVLGGSSSSTVGGGSQTQASISYLPIGTVINILPKKMQNDKVNLNISITLSSIIGTQLIQGNPYPVASSRIYRAPVEVNDRYTVAIGGLDEAKEQVTDAGIPVLNKIPLVGYLFKTRSKSKNHKNLMIFITPTILDSKEGGLSPEPQAVLPRKPDIKMPQVPKLAAGGGIEGGIAALPNAVAFMKRSADEIGQVILENRGTKQDYGKLGDLKTAIHRLEREVDKYITTHPEAWNELSHYKAQLDDIESSITRHCLSLAKKGYY